MEQVYNRAVDYYAGMLRDIHNAQYCIDLEVYIFVDDDLGRRFISALCAAAARDCKVRVLIDGVGSGIRSHEVLRPLLDSEVEARIYRPLPWRFWQWSLAANKASGLSQFIYLLNLINRRNHRKVMTVDQRIVWLGSFNLCQQHLPINQGGESWRDCGVRLDSCHADELKLAFDTAWLKPEQDAAHQVPSSGQFRLNYNRQLRAAHRKGVLRHIGQARHRVWVTNAYFIPSAKLLSALSRAAERGVDVRLLLPGRSDIFFMPWASALFYGQLLRAGVKIFEYQEAVLHAKNLIVDSWVCVGTSNLNQRSWLHDLEVDAVLQEPHAIREFVQQFLTDQLDAAKVEVEPLRKMGIIKRCIGRIALLLRYWL